MGRKHIALRKGRHSVSGQIYLVTFTTARGQPYFSEWAIAADAARLMTAKGDWQGSQLLAWVLMPDHWHGLMQLGEGETLPGRVGWIKAHAARQLRKAHPDIGRIWAGAYHDRALRKEDDVLQVARYLVLNPVRAGLARRVGDYPFWDAVRI